MSWLTGRRSANTYICPEDKYVAKSNDESLWEYIPDQGKINAKNSYVCPYCRKALIDMGTRWRAPKKLNHKAWTKILSGDIWWDKKSLAKSHVYNSEYDNAHITKYYLKQKAKRDG